MADDKQGNVQGGIEMPYPDPVINGRTIPASRWIKNPLTAEACARYNIDSLDNDLIHTNLRAVYPNTPLVSPQTSALVFYVSHRLDLLHPVHASLGLRLNNPVPAKTEVDAIIYAPNGSGYDVLPGYHFTLPGEIGCTAVANLGFLLLRDVQRITTRQLGILTLIDKTLHDATLDLDIPVADDTIIDFCRERGGEVIAPKEVSDCPEYPECDGQPGVKCAQYRARCRRKA